MIKNHTTTLGSLFTLLIMALVISSCGTIKEAQSSTEHISVKESYVQKYVSGQQGGGETTYLFIDIDILDSTIILDSVSYDYYMAPVSAVRMPLKINFMEGKKFPESPSSNVDNSSATLYYTKGKKRFKRIVEGITVKEDLYLP